MKIVVISEYFYPDNSGGTPTDLSELTRWLVGNRPDIEIDVITSRNLYRSTVTANELPLQEQWGRIFITRLSVPKSNRPSTVLRLVAGGLFSMAALLRVAYRGKYDLVFIVTNPPANAMAGWLYGKVSRVPYVYLVHDLYPDIAVALGKMRRDSRGFRGFAALQRKWLTGAAKVVVLGRCMKQHLVHSYGLPSGRVEIVSSWADRDTVIAEERSVGAKTPREFIVLYGGNFSHYVNFDQLLEAGEFLRDCPAVRFVLVGDGVRKAELAEKVASRNLTNVQIRERVPRSEMAYVLAAADVAFISLDKRMLGLGVPSKLYSILAAGKPVVAVVPASCEVAAVLREERCGIVVDEGDAMALARELRRLSVEPEAVSNMGRNAAAAFIQRFTLERSGGRFAELLLAEGAGSRARRNIDGVVV